MLVSLLYYALFDLSRIQHSEAPVARNAIERWKEWLGNQYNPGCFTGGRIHPTYHASGWPVGILFIFSGILPLVLVVMSVFKGVEKGEAGILVSELRIGLVMIVAGLARVGGQTAKLTFS